MSLRLPKDTSMRASMVTLGELNYKQLPDDNVIKPNRCLDIVHGIGASGNQLGVRCRSLTVGFVGWCADS